MPIHVKFTIPTCRLCGEPGHNRRTCGLRQSSPPPMSAEERATFERFKAAEAEERAAFERFRAAEEERKREEQRMAAQEAERKAEEKREAQAQAINLFKEMLAKWANELYNDSDVEILRKGKLVIQSGAGAIEYPHSFLTYWRDQRYKAQGVVRANYAYAMGHNPWLVNGHDADGWPLRDEADVEAARLLAVEWSQFNNFCRRFAERAERAA
jgi:hypothetical protein